MQVEAGLRKPTLHVFGANSLRQFDHQIRRHINTHYFYFPAQLA